MAGSVGGWRLRPHEQSAHWRILSANRAECVAAGKPRGAQRRCDSLRWAKKVISLSHSWTACRDRSPNRRGEHPRSEFLGLRCLVAVANDLSQQAAAPGKEGTCRLGLDSRPVFREGLRLRDDAATREQA